MTNQEFSNEFDILYNNITSNQAPGLTEYEKSVVLTQAQDSFVLDIYKGNTDAYSFESTEEATSYLGDLVKQSILSTPISSESKISSSSIFFQLPSDVWFITYESVILNDDRLGCKSGQEALVKPITQDEYYSLSRNPFRGPNDIRVLRLLIGDKAELISKYNIQSYLIRYLSEPEPIILEDLEEYGTSIKGKTSITECKLNPVVHRIILNLAVQIAKNIWASGLS